MEFPTPEARKEYLHEHPGADPANHTVKKQDPKSKGEEASPKGLFNPDETKGLPNAASQKTTDPDKLFENAKDAHEHQLKWLNHGQGLEKALGASVIRADKGDKVDFSKVGPIILIGPMKKKERAKEKVDADYGGDWSKLNDVVRASVAVDTYEDLEKTLDKLRKSGLKLARQPKDRFAKPTEAGYRDVLLNVEYPNGHVGELQLHVKSMLKAKDAGHKLYEGVRTIEGNAKKEGRDTLTDKEMAAINEANSKMKALYDDAWKEANVTPKDRDKNASFRVGSQTKYYVYEDLPAYWEPNKFPKIVNPKEEKTVYDLEKFFREADPIDERKFNELKKSSK